MSRERLHTTIEQEALEYLAILKIRHRFKGLNDSIEYLVKLHKEGKLLDNERNTNKTK